MFQTWGINNLKMNQMISILLIYPQKLNQSNGFKIGQTGGASQTGSKLVCADPRWLGGGDIPAELVTSSVGVGAYPILVDPGCARTLILLLLTPGFLFSWSISSAQNSYGWFSMYQVRCHSSLVHSDSALLRSLWRNSGLVVTWYIKHNPHLQGSKLFWPYTRI